MSQRQYTQQYVTETDFSHEDNMISHPAYSSNCSQYQPCLHYKNITRTLSFTSGFIVNSKPKIQGHFKDFPHAF